MRTSTLRSMCAALIRKGLLRSLPVAGRLINDYGNSLRYAEENRALATVGGNENRVVFIGDSIIDFWGRGEFAASAPFFSGRPFVNRGISGQVTAQMLVRFYSDVIALRPKAVVLLGGINDIGGNLGRMADEVIQNNLASMADIATANYARVIVCSLLPVSDYHVRRTGYLHPERILRVNRWLAGHSASRRHIYLDYFSEMVDSSGFLRQDLSDDGLHPNANGYAVMAPLTENAVAQALGTD